MGAIKNLIIYSIVILITIAATLIMTDGTIGIGLMFLIVSLSTWIFTLIWFAVFLYSYNRGRGHDVR